MDDKFKFYGKGELNTPNFSEAQDVVPDDVLEFDFASRALFIGVAGDVKVDMIKGGTVTFKNVAAGSVLHVRASKVYATGTSATDIIKLL